MRENGLVSAYGRKRFKVHPGAANEANVPNVVARGFGGRAPRTHICSDLAYVRVGAWWNYVCLLVDLYNREVVGHSAGPWKDTRLVRSAFATLSFPISNIEVFHMDRGSEFDNAEIDLMLKAFGIERLLSAKGCPCDNAVDESTNGILKAELIHREAFGTTRELRAKFSDYVHWYNNFRIHSTLGYMSPVEFRRRGCPSRNRPNRCCQSTLRSISERCAKRIGEAARILEAQNEVFYAEGQEPVLNTVRQKGTLRSRRESRRVARSASSIPAGARNWGALDQLSPLMVSSSSAM